MPRIFSPYRICPLGAHVDHQGGPVLGRTILMGTALEYEPLETDEVVLTSVQFGTGKFRIGDLDPAHWMRYAQAAARLLPSARRGMRARVNGSLPGAGLSSSASVGLAYLKALSKVNGIDLTREQLVQLEYRLEHDELGLQIGYLDPLTIVHGKRNALLFMDTLTSSITVLPDPPSGGSAWIVAYSGLSRELARSGFNVRVEECRQAASLLKRDAKILSDVPRDVFEQRKKSLPPYLCKRAEHYFSEVDRVHRGAKAWKEADLEEFGQLMNRSCESSIRNYESGSENLVELHELVSRSPGIYGSRFSGGGYGGCVVALANRALSAQASAEIAETYARMHPGLPSKVFVAETSDGLGMAA